MIRNHIKTSYNNKGSAIITALVVSTVVMILCLSLLAVAYSLFLSQKANTSNMSNKEMLYSAIELFEKELENAIWIDEDLDLSEFPVEAAASITKGSTGSQFGRTLINDIWRGFNKNNFGEYVQSNSGNWLYYDAKDLVHKDKAACSRYFYLYSVTSVNVIAQVYWELPSWSVGINGETGETWDGSESKKEGTVLHVIYRLYNSDMEVQIKTERIYRLSGTVHEVNDGNLNLGDYKIVFHSKNPSFEGYVPQPRYFDSLSMAPDLSNSSFTWYTNEDCEPDKVYTNSLTDEDFISSTDPNETAKYIKELWTDWDGNIPVKVDFIVEGKCKKTMVIPSGSTINIHDAPDAPPFTQNNSDDIFIKWWGGKGKNAQVIEFDESEFFVSSSSQSIISDYYVFAMYNSYFSDGNKGKKKGTFTKIKPGQVPGHNISEIVPLSSSSDSKYYISYSWKRVIDK